MPIDITMPRLSDTMEAGTIIKWNVKEGDKVSAGDVIADVETDKATMEMAVYDDGVIAKISVPEGKKVNVGTVIATLNANGESSAKPAADAPKAASSAEPAKKPAAKAKAAGSETAKRDDDGDAAVAVAEPPAKSSRDAANRDAAAPEDAPEDSGGEVEANGRLRISPVARHMADEHGIDVRSIEGTGPSGRVIKRDVIAAIDAAKETTAAVAPSARAKPATAPKQEVLATRVEKDQSSTLPAKTQPRTIPSASGGDTESALEAQMVPLSNMRQIIAKRLVESKQTIPHYQVTVTFNMDPLLDLRATLNKQLEDQGVKLSVNDFLVRACALAIHKHPYFNAAWAEDHIEILSEVNVGMAISLPEERGGGLVVGVVRNADAKGLRQISAESKQLAEKARTRGLNIQEMSDATFTISNLGMFGVDNFTAIINPPNSAILAVGAAIKKPVVRDDQLTIGHEMNATLSLDHRVIDGAMAAQYLQTLRLLIENPGTVLV